MNMKTSLALATITALSITAAASAQLRITEAMSNALAFGNADWFEVTNFGPTAISLAGYRMDDNSFGVPSTAPVALNNVASIAPGESVVFIESAAATTEVPAFRTAWNIPASIQIGDYSGSGVGLSSGGDGVIIFDSASTEVHRVTFGAATTGSSFEFLPASFTAAVSVSGANGAYTINTGNASAPFTNIGSPGLIPEPATLMLAVAGAGILLRRRGK
jgi:Lamin Tail Domain